MKLSQLSEDIQADTIAKQQAVKNLAYVALTKARKILGPMGLLKGGQARPNTSSEPAPEAVSAFQDLRQAIQKRLLRDMAKIVSGRHIDSIEQFWGFAVPSGYYDSEKIQQSVRRGKFDELLAQTRDAAVADESGMLKPIEQRIGLLKQLATIIGH